MFLSRDQRRRAVAAAAGAVASIPIIGGVGALRTDEVQALAGDAAAEGASGLLLAPVSYTGQRCWRAPTAGTAWLGLFPEQAAALAAAAVRGDREEAGRCDVAFAGMWNLFRAHSSLRLMYAAASMLGLTEASPPKPLLGPDEGLTVSVRKALPL